MRELRSFVERALVFGGRKALTMTAEDEAPSPSATAAPAVLSDRPLKAAREAWMDRFEREYLELLLARHHRNVAAAAQAADVHRTYLYRLIAKHGL